MTHGKKPPKLLPDEKPGMVRKWWYLLPAVVVGAGMWGAFFWYLAH